MEIVSARPVGIWGVLNVTPDSFSDGGRYLALDAALGRSKAMLAEGADVIDVGGASSRPKGATYGAGAQDVSVETELVRVVPVIEVLARELGARVSIDTTRGAVAAAALRAGARIVNDVSMGRDDALLAAVSLHGAELVLMHSRGAGEVTPANTAYGDVVRDVMGELEDALARAERAGIARERLWIDPGLGFAKTPSQSAELLARCAELCELGARVLIGASRKSFLASITRGAPAASERLPASLAAAIVAVRAGAHAVRVHDVAETRQALDVLEAVRRVEARHA